MKLHTVHSHSENRESGLLVRHFCKILTKCHRVGGGVAPTVLPHHRAYGSVPRRFMSHIEADAGDSAETRDQVHQRSLSGKLGSYERHLNSTTGHAGL